MLSQDDFMRYGTDGFNLVPLWRHMNGTGLTPLAVYRHLANRGNDYLFETGSFHGGRFMPDFSYVGLPCDEHIELTDDQVSFVRNGLSVREETTLDPLAVLQNWLADIKIPQPDGLPPFSGGLFGYFGYETVRMIEDRLARMPRKPSLLEMPDVLQLVTKELVIFDHTCGEIIYVVHAIPDSEQSYLRALHRLDEIEDALETTPTEMRPSIAGATPANETEKKLEFHFPQEDYEAAVDRIKEYINAGDVMQVVLSQRMACSLSADATEFYRAVTAINPSPYSYILNLGDCQIVGTSPEMLTHCQQGTVFSRPMAGTRRRGSTMQEDHELKVELLNDPKELAEHTMLVDLARNDVGRLASVGSVTVNEKMIVENFSHVMHIVSTVSGRLPPDTDAISVLKGTFPAGTLSGASKIRAIEIINELEPHSRGIYGGAIGYLNWNGDLDLAITIRTGVISKNMLYLQAGAGIVMDSCAAREWQETIEKGSVLAVAASRAELQGHASTSQVNEEITTCIS